MMTDLTDSNREADSIDTGEPIAALRTLEEPASDSFMGALHHRIQRRLLVADVGRLTWTGPVTVIVEFLNIIFGLIGVADPNEHKE